MPTTDLPRPSRERAALEEALRRGPAIVAAGPGACALDLVSEVSGQPLVVVEAAAAGTAAGLVVDLTRQVLRLLAPRSQIGTKLADTHRDDLVALARAYPRKLDDGIAAGMGLPPADFSIDDALGALPPDVLLAVDSAHLLTQRWAEQTLWAMRGHAEERRLRIALSVPEWARSQLVGPDAAFFGFAEVVSINNRADVGAWVAALRADWNPFEVEWVVHRTQGQFAAMADIIEHARSHETGLRDGWEAIVWARAPLVPAAIRAAQSLTSLGGRLLRAIALGRRPYPSVPRVAPNRVASSLNILKRAGLVYSRGRADWQLSDPLLAAAFSLPSGPDMSEDPPDWLLR